MRNRMIDRTTAGKVGKPISKDDHPLLAKFCKCDETPSGNGEEKYEE